MRQQLAPPWLFIALSAVGITGCGPPECVEDFDCGIGNRCEAQRCVNGGGGNGNGNGNEGEGEGEGENALSIVDDLEAVASMLQPSSDIGGPPELALVGQYDPVGNIDKLFTFDVVAGAFVDNDFDLDFLNTSIGGNPGRCNLDQMSLEVGVDPEGKDELWWSCGLSGLQQSLSDDFNNIVVSAGADGADLILRLLQPDDRDPNIQQRRVFARRGGSDLVVEQVTLGIANRGLARDRDTVVPLFGEIAGLTLITETNDANYGDIVLVFDRTYPGAGDKPALVPLERQNTESGDSATWDFAQPPWRVIALPDDTHAVRVVGAVPDPDQLILSGAEPQTANLEVYLPVQGEVAFARLETEMSDRGDVAFDPDVSGFVTLLFESGDRPTTVPSSSDRVLITPVPGAADSVFYVTTNQAFGWKLRLHRDVNDDFVNDVERAEFFDESRDLPSAMVSIPNVDDTVWIAVKNVAELHPITFALGN